jgi:hypothetical protein
VQTEVNDQAMAAGNSKSEETIRVLEDGAVGWPACSHSSRRSLHC